MAKPAADCWSGNRTLLPAVSMPITAPAALTSGPPDSPATTPASVWTIPCSVSDATTPPRSLAARRVDHHAGARGPLAAVLQLGVDDDDALPDLGQAPAGGPAAARHGYRGAGQRHGCSHARLRRGRGGRVRGRVVESHHRARPQ